MPDAQVERARRHVRGGVEEHVPPVCVRLLDPLEWMLHTREVRLRRIREQVVVVADRVGEISREHALVDTQIGRDAGYVRGVGAARARELTDAVDRVVIVEREQEAVTRAERICLADQP